LRDAGTILQYKQRSNAKLM